MMTSDPFRNRMDDDEDMPRGYKMTHSEMLYQEHVEIILEDKGCAIVSELITKHLGSVVNESSYAAFEGNRLWYVFEGTSEQMEKAGKILRRLSRGKPRFQVVWG